MNPNYETIVRASNQPIKLEVPKRFWPTDKLGFYLSSKSLRGLRRSLILPTLGIAT